MCVCVWCDIRKKVIKPRAQGGKTATSSLENLRRLSRMDGGDFAQGEFAGDSAVASRRQVPPSEINASLGSSLIYAFITVNNASPFTSGLSCRSFSQACLPIYPTPVYLVPSFISQSYTPREPFHRAPRFSESDAFSQMYFKTTRRSHIYPSPTVSARPLLAASSGWIPVIAPLVLTNIKVEIPWNMAR